MPADPHIDSTESSGAFYSPFLSAGGTAADFRMRGRQATREGGEGAGDARSYLGDAGVGAFDIPAGPVEPGLGGRRAAVRLQGALGLAAAPAALELGVGFQAEPAALALGRAFVEVHCGKRGDGRSGQSQELR